MEMRIEGNLGEPERTNEKANIVLFQTSQQPLSEVRTYGTENHHPWMSTWAIRVECALFGYCGVVSHV
jgi:hypothetical protein